MHVRYFRRLLRAGSRTVLVALLALGALATQAQPGTGQITGRVIDERSEAVPFAAVTLLRATDSVLVRGVVSDEAGRYRLDGVAGGHYRLEAAQLGYRRGRSPVVGVEPDSLAVVVDFQLRPEAQALGEVQVTARRSLVVQQLDRTVLDVEHSSLSVGTTVLDVLRRAPDVVVDENGAISLKGKAGVLVLLNGKPTYLSPQQLYQRLRGLPSSQVARVEVMTNPPAKYDAAGSAGIIDIQLKRDEHFGWNGTLNLGYGQGRYVKRTGGGQFNFRQQQWNVFGGYDYTRNDDYFQITGTRRFPEVAAGFLFDQEARYTEAYSAHNYRSGVDFFATPRTTLGLLLVGMRDHSAAAGRNPTRVRNAAGALDSSFVTLDNTVNRLRNLSANVNLRHAFDTLGRELTADLNQGRYRHANTQLFTTQRFGADGALRAAPAHLRIKSPSVVDIRTAKLDYVQPLAARSRLEAGVKLSWVRTDNDARFFVGQGIGERVDPARSNMFGYRENIAAAYVQARRAQGKLGVQLGLRAERTASVGRLATAEAAVARTYTQLFPNAAVQYTPSKQHSWRASYSRRLDRPTYADLNPFVYLQDPYTYDTGNPYLRPQLTQLVELGHGWLNGTLLATLSYSRTRQVFAEVLRQNDATRVTVGSTENLGRLENAGLVLAYTAPLTAWWTTSTSLNVFWRRYASSFQDGTLDNGRGAATLTSAQSFTLPGGIGAEVSGLYRTASPAGLGIRQATGQLSVGLQKSFWADKATLKLNATDIFHTLRTANRTVYQNLDLETETRWDSRVVTLAAAYVFGRTGVVPAHTRRTGLEEEQARQGR